MIRTGIFVLTAILGLNPNQEFYMYIDCDSPFPVQAYIELDGRFFGGRSVWVCFFREADFDSGAFAPSAKEPK